MSPYERAFEWFQQHPQHHTFSEYVTWHCLHAFCYATPEFFIFGRAVKKRANEAEMMADIHSFRQFDRNEQDTWFIHMAAGNLKEAWSIMPYYLPWLAFERLRGGELTLTIVSTERMRNATDTLIA